MSASEFIPGSGGMKALREAAAGCRSCHLHEHATQTVFGEGPRSARGELLGSPLAPVMAATIHPSAIVRDRDAGSREAERRALASDLRTVAEAAAAA